MLCRDPQEPDLAEHRPRLPLCRCNVWSRYRDVLTVRAEEKELDHARPSAFAIAACASHAQHPHPLWWSVGRSGATRLKASSNSGAAAIR